MCKIIRPGYRCKSEKEMAPHSSTLAWKIPWAEEPGRLQSMGSHRVRHDWGTSLSLFTFMYWRRKWQCSCLENPRDGGAWWAAIYGVTQSRTWLKWHSSSSSSSRLQKASFSRMLGRTCVLSRVSHVRFFVIPWTIVNQVSLSMGFFRQEYWSRLLFPSPRVLI